ncbi:helix-turn-helix transcriptional regulator [Streptomyces hebeiensis]|uniref:Helix-turn-helix transcriptional regulator n=1 Tax=Streptomyces hebeiensis TaxID=229486 RepID=A0ABN1UK49_9ACTN
MGTSRQKKPQRARNDDRPGIWIGYGKLVGLLRERAGLSRQDLADAVGCSYRQIASIEEGRRPAKPAFTDTAETLLKAGGVLAVLQEQVSLAQRPLFFRSFSAIEAAAMARYSYDPMMVPPLLQTEAYARRLMASRLPPLDGEDLDRHVAARLARQSLLTRGNPPPLLVFVIEESVLHRPIGGRDALREQLGRLLECGRLRHVEIQVLPLIRSGQAAVHGPLVLVETVEREQLAYVESWDGGSLVTERAEVSDIAMRFGMVRSQALDPEESARMIERAAAKL